MTELVKTHDPMSRGISTYSSALDALNTHSATASSYRNFASEIAALPGSFESPRVVYIFDSNICLSFLRPRERVFMDAAGVSRLFSRGREVAVERMTVRYLFEGLLPGQDGEPIFLAPAHWNELLNRSERLFSDKSRRAAKLKNQITDEKLAQLRSVEGDPHQLVQMAEKLGIARAMQELGDALELARRVEILFGESNEEGRIRGLDQATSPNVFRAWNDARKQVSWRVENDWRRTISEVKREALKERFQGVPASQREAELERLRQATLADASSLALIETLFMVDPLAGGESPQRRYVFVTSDTAIAEASLAQKARLEENGIPVFVQSPALFLPVADYQHFHDTITSQPDTSTTSRETSDKIYEAVSSLRHLPRKHQVSERNRVRTLRENWNYTADLLTLIGNEKFVDDFTGQSDAERVKNTYKLLTYEKIGSAIEQMLQEKMANVSKRHGRVSIEFALELLPERLSPPAESTSDPRAPVHFLAVDVLQPLRDADATECTNWSAFVAELQEDAATDGAKVRRVSEALREIWSSRHGQLPSAAVLLLTAAVLTSAGMWDEALKCANWATAAARKKRRRANSVARQRQGNSRRAQADPIALEASYVSALCQRMSLRNTQQFNLAKDRLNDNVQARSSDRSLPFPHRIANFRDLIEKSTLILTAAVVQSIEAWSIDEDLDEFHTERYFTDEDLADAYQAAIDALEMVVDDLENDYVNTDSSNEDLRLILGLILRARTNILGAEINRHFMPSLQPEAGSLSLIAEAARAIWGIKNDFQSSLPRNRVSQEIYLRVAEFMMADSSSKLDFDDLMRDFAIVLSENASIPDHVEMRNLGIHMRGLAETRGLLLPSRSADVS